MSEPKPVISIEQYDSSQQENTLLDYQWDDPVETWESLDATWGGGETILHTDKPKLK